MYFIVNVSPPKLLNIPTSNFTGASVVLGNNSCKLDPKVKVKSQIMYFLLNASPPYQLDIIISNCAGT